MGKAYPLKEEMSEHLADARGACAEGKRTASIPTIAVQDLVEVECC